MTEVNCVSNIIGQKYIFCLFVVLLYLLVFVFYYKFLVSVVVVYDEVDI